MSSFPVASEIEWRERVAKTLKGQDFDARLVSEREGIRIDPLHGRMDGPQAGRPKVAPWRILQRVDHPVPTRAATLAQADLAGGADGLVLAGKDDNTTNAPGIAPLHLPLVLAKLSLHQIDLRVEGGDDMSKALASYVATQPIDPARLAITFDCDDRQLVKDLRTQGFLGPYVTADGRMFQAEGQNSATELGCSLAWAALSLRKLDFLDDAQLARVVSITLAATPDMFMTMAKFRAMHLLWARFLELCKLPFAPLSLHGEVARTSVSAKDPHTNLLRAVASSFGAGLGGATSFTVLPFSQAQGIPNGFARRTARNVQTILLQESQLWRVHDPAHGAGYVEHLTSTLCEKAWDVFRNCERGQWPDETTPDPSTLPVIGVSAHALEKEPAPEVEMVP